MGDAKPHVSLRIILTQQARPRAPQGHHAPMSNADNAVCTAIEVISKETTEAKRKVKGNYRNISAMTGRILSVEATADAEWRRSLLT